MSETDALSTFDFSKVTGGGLFVKFEAGKPLTLRVLTLDPVVSEQTYEDKKTGEINISTKFAFIVYNFTEEKAQILSASPAMARKIGELHTDEDFGANIRKIDIKISPTGEKLERRYDIQVLPNAKTLTNDMIKECQAIDLDAAIKEGGRMSLYDPEKHKPQEESGYETAKRVRETLGAEDEVHDVNDEPVNLDDIPF